MWMKARSPRCDESRKPLYGYGGIFVHSAKMYFTGDTSNFWAQIFGAVAFPVERP
jgi:hypothetical protein